jgi:HEAT repeat protein
MTAVKKLFLMALFCIISTAALGQDDKGKQADEEVDAESILKQVTDKKLTETVKKILSKGKKTPVLEEAKKYITKKTWTEQLAAVVVISQLGSKEQIKDLAKLLDSKHEDVREETAQALQRAGFDVETVDRRKKKYRLKGAEDEEKKPDWPSARKLRGAVGKLLAKVRAGDRRDKIKAAKELGDMVIAGRLPKLSKAEKDALSLICDQLLKDAGDREDHQKRIFATEQLERLWTISASKLADALADSNMTRAEAAAKRLILMRNKSICKLLKEKYTDADDNTRGKIVFVLGQMKEQRKAKVKDRSCLGEEESEKLVQKEVLPFLKEVLTTDKSVMVRHGIARALKNLGVEVETVDRGTGKYRLPGKK